MSACPWFALHLCGRAASENVLGFPGVSDTCRPAHGVVGHFYADDDCAASPALANVNVRTPILIRQQVSLQGIPSIWVVLRRGEDPGALASLTCDYVKRRRGVGCSTVEKDDLNVQVLSFLTVYEAMNPGEQAVMHARMGWELLLSHNLWVEARLQFTHALANFPSSSFLLREYAAFGVLSTQLVTGGVGGHGGSRGIQVEVDGTWSYAKSGPDTHLETWESYAALRFQAPSRSLAEEESALLGAGVPALAFIPHVALVGLQRETLNFTHTHRLRHDLELIQLLQDRGLVPEHIADAAVEAYTAVLMKAPRVNDGLMLSVASDWDVLYPYFNRRLYIHPAGRVPGGAVSRRGVRSVTLMQSGTVATSLAGGLLSEGGVLVIDDLLTPMALQELRDFAELSTIWYKEHGSYLGATMRTGFSSQLIDQIAEELRAAFPDLLCDLALEHTWGFKFDDELQSGISIHADGAAMNVNLWITPDENNLDPDNGGLVIYDATVSGTNLTFAEYNSGSDRGAQDRLLRDTNYRNISVPYRQNRAVIFDSARLHGTAPFNFRRGLKSRRINITFLFGHQGGYCSMKRSSEALGGTFQKLTAVA